MAPRGYIGVVGESHYQDALKNLMATAQPSRIVTVGVAREIDNPFDPKAIRVFDPATGNTLGYLPRGTTGFVKLLREHSIERHAELTGGTTQKPSIGLVLYLHGEQVDDIGWEEPHARTVVAPVDDTQMSQFPKRSADASTTEVKSGGAIRSLIGRWFGRRG
jgi:hypothetical protein